MSGKKFSWHDQMKLNKFCWVGDRSGSMFCLLCQNIRIMSSDDGHVKLKIERLVPNEAVHTSIETGCILKAYTR